MRTAATWFGSLALISLTPALAPVQEDGPPPVDDLRASIRSALPYLERDGVGWIEEHDCVSCHQVPSFLWALRAAETQGIALDPNPVERWSAWSAEKLSGNDEAATLAASLLANLTSPTPLDSTPMLVERLAATQHEDGSFDADDGQSTYQRRPIPETHEVTTAWSALALAAAGHGGAERARTSLGPFDGDETTEWVAARALVEEAFGDRAQRDELVSALLDRQADDGGWGWREGEPSDALATGQALVALGSGPGERQRASVERAWRFLHANQRDDGSWRVPTTLAREEGSLPTSDYWGTAWAVVGLARTLPAPIPAPATHYRGREIAEVMKPSVGRWLMRAEREREERPALLLAALGIERGSTVGEIGAGNGFFTPDLARLVGPEGRVYAVDIQEVLLDELRARVSEAGLDNVEVVLGTVVDPRLPPASCDLVAIIDAYHEFSHPAEMIRAARRALRPGGRLAIAEFRTPDEEPRNARLPREHTMTRAQIEREIVPMGFQVDDVFEGLPRHHLLIFERAGEEVPAESGGAGGRGDGARAPARAGR